MTTRELASRLDAILAGATTGPLRAPGVVAFASDRDGDFYRGAAGVRRLGDPAAMTEDTVFALFSCTKAITATAVLQLVEHGRLELDAPAKAYLPEIGALQVLEGFDDAGAPRLRPPKRDVTTRMLMLHTAGFGYEFFNAEYRRLTLERGQINPRLGTRAGLNVPLLFDPGERWEYGLSLDWAGRVVEAVTGETLDAVLRAGVLEPLGMNDTTFALSPGMRERRAAMHQFDENGALVPFEFELPEAPEVFMGGGALFGTVGDYMRFLRMWLNDGAGERGRVLKAETVAYAVQNGLGDLEVRPLPGVNPAITRDAEFFPGQSKSWALSFMVNDQAAPTGRPAGSLGWAGLGNLFYWIDRRNGIAGFWATQMFPFMHPTPLAGSSAFETAIYESRKDLTPGLPGAGTQHRRS